MDHYEPWTTPLPVRSSSHARQHPDDVCLVDENEDGEGYDDQVTSKVSVIGIDSFSEVRQKPSYNAAPGLFFAFLLNLPRRGMIASCSLTVISPNLDRSASNAPSRL